LSASIEFQSAYGQTPPCEPDLSQISVDDVRVKDSPWYTEGVSTPPRPASKVKLFMLLAIRMVTLLNCRDRVENESPAVPVAGPG
jgi:hypothetical protein